MRIISQNNEHDVPYEQCTLWTEYSKNIRYATPIGESDTPNTIYATPIGESDTLLKMGKYSTQEKAEKAMEKLRHQYQEGHKNTIFIFPKEDEI